MTVEAWIYPEQLATEICEDTRAGVVYSIWRVQDHISGFICRNKPPAIVLSGKLGRLFGQQPCAEHILVESRPCLFIREPAGFCLGGELVFQLLSEVMS